MARKDTSLHQIEICVAQNQPLRAGRLKIHFDPGMGALPLAVEDNAIAKLFVADTLAEANSKFIAGCSGGSPALR